MLPKGHPIQCPESHLIRYNPTINCLCTMENTINGNITYSLSDNFGVKKKKNLQILLVKVVWNIVLVQFYF